MCAKTYIEPQTTIPVYDECGPFSPVDICPDRILFQLIKEVYGRTRKMRNAGFPQIYAENE